MQPVHARPAKVCASEDGNLRVKSRCKTTKGETEVSLSSISALAKGDKGDSGEKGDTGNTGATGPAGDSVILCYGHLDSAGNVLSFGGHGTSNVTVSHSTGIYNITCTGSYPGITSTDDLSIVGSAVG